MSGQPSTSSSPAELLTRIRAFCARPPPAVLFDETAGMLLDLASGKTLKLDLASLVSVEERKNTQTGEPYLVLADGAGGSRVLCSAGVAFAPEFKNTGPLPDLTSVVCFKDYALLLARMKHQLYGHGEAEPGRETVRLLLMCIAIIDGARAQGFGVDQEERELEWHLAELERRAPQATP